MNNYSTARYEEEKHQGVRRPTGAMNLTQLKPIHYKILSLHLQGYRNQEIAAATGYTEASISRLINDPLAQQYIDEAYKSEDSRIKALHGKAIDALSDGLGKENKMVDRLRASRQVFELNGKLNGKGSGTGETAEDVVKRVLNLVQVNVNVPAGRTELEHQSRDAEALEHDPDGSAGQGVSREAGSPAADSNTLVDPDDPATKEGVS